MAYMRAEISAKKRRFISSFNGELEEYCGLLDDGDYDEDMEDDDPAYREDYSDELKELLAKYDWQFTITTAYYGLLSAPSSMDRTDITVGDTQQEVAQQLLDMYFDGDPEYMDEDEKEDEAWLTRVANGMSPKEALLTYDEEGSE